MKTVIYNGREIKRLKKCPFCGGSAMVGVNYLGQWCVACDDCSATMWGRGEGEDGKTSAINAWNKRKYVEG